MIRRLLLPAGLALCLCLGLWARQALVPRIQSETLYVFGTLVEVEIEGVSDRRASEAMAALGQLFRRLHRDWHAWRPGELGRLNQAIARGDSFESSPGLAALLAEGQELSSESGGLFDPGIGAMIGLWGFHADLPPEGPPPPDAEIEALAARHPSIAVLQIDGTRISSPNPAVQLDLGGFAKGAALDLAAEELRRRGISNAVLNAGGDVNVLGRKGARPWRVAIRSPFDWGAVAALDVQPGEMVYTSGNYERFLDQDGIRFSHILDPRSGRPVQGIVSATVLARNGALADAAATALSVAGPAHWQDTARAMGIDAALLIDDRGRISMTPAMAARVQLLEPAPVEIAGLGPQ
ncbi:FAD:protein FMN transferase [Mangrovicoccus sp. HB161399]|uniref:FAD:protein FMN transferase n=1 Tax=Mangrovicoccus sp. HB161399 TaxID=2720392 RepID=UPI0015529D07|nr:FAD:protein FMN transferase [Mangrovicoccus sp. HB161399]